MEAGGASAAGHDGARIGDVDLAALLAVHVEELADDVLERFAAGAGPDGAPDAATLRNLRLGARAAVERFLARLRGDALPDEGVALFVAHGRAQQAAGRTLTELLSFYRLGGLAMWERSTALLPQDASLPAAETFAFGQRGPGARRRAVASPPPRASAPRRPRRAGATARCASGSSRCCSPTRRSATTSCAARPPRPAGRCPTTSASRSPRCRPTRSRCPPAPARTAS